MLKYPCIEPTYVLLFLSHQSIVVSMSNEGMSEIVLRSMSTIACKSSGSFPYTTNIYNLSPPEVGESSYSLEP